MDKASLLKAPSDGYAASSIKQSHYAQYLTGNVHLTFLYLNAPKMYFVDVSFVGAGWSFAWV